MARIRIQLDDDFSDWPLASTELVGRHWRNSLRMRHPSVPQFWLELRWRGGGWCWRPLAGAEITRGTGAVDATGWRQWPQAGGVVRLDGGGAVIELRLLDVDPPEPLVEALATRRRLPVHQATGVIELWPDGRLWPLGADTATETPLEPGDVFAIGDDIYRLLEAASPPPTDRLGPSLAEAGLTLTLDLQRLQALVEGQDWSAQVQGECVRVIATYARARVSDADGGGGGWLPTDAAFAEWVALGGRSASPPTRLGWERGKFRTQLAQQSVSGLERLFESRRHDGLAEVRLALQPEQISVRPEI